MLIMVNDISDIRPKDAYSNMLFVDMPCTFQENESELAKRRDPDPEIKNFVSLREVHLALIDILLDSYGPENYKLMKLRASDLVEESEENILSKILELFEKTNNEKDKILAVDFDRELKKIDMVLTTVKRKRYIERLGIKQKKITKGIVYIGLKLRDQKEEN
jgi:hypothetical protein